MHLTRTGYALQLQEAQQEAETQRQRGDAAELALQSEKRQHRAAELVRSRPTSPLRDAALHSELAGLKHQVADLSGRLQQSEQANAALLAHLAVQQTQPHGAMTWQTEAAMSDPSEQRQSGTAVSGQRQRQTAPEVQQCSTSQQHDTALHNIRTDAARDLFDSSDEEEQQHATSSSSDRQSSGHQAESASSAKSQAAQGHQTLQGISNCQQAGSLGAASVAQASFDASKMSTTLQALAETLAVDVVRLKQLLEGRLDGSAAIDIKAANWGFPKPALDNSPEPSRPVTAGPCDSMQRPDRQCSAGSAQHRTGQQYHTDYHQQPRSSRPATAGQYGNDAAGMPLHAAAGRYNGRQGRRRKAESEWYDPVPPTRMPEEILQQAREDYIREKNRVRHKRLQELNARAADANVAAVA